MREPHNFHRRPSLGQMPREECGICAVVGHPEAAKLTYLGLHALQHRGQETAGIVAADNGNHRIHRGLGLVAEVFTADILERLTGPVAIGHVRYSTTGSPRPANTQPLVANLRHGPVALAHNGNLTNAHVLQHALKAGGAIFQTTVDSEVILHLLSRCQYDDFAECLAVSLEKVQGAYSLLVLYGDILYAVRDPRGFRPLCLGRLPGGGYVVASETVAFDLIDAQPLRDIAPGEILRINIKKQGAEKGQQVERSAPGSHPICSLRSMSPFPPVEPAFCVFEYIYYSRPDSVIAGRSVEHVREALGEALWREHPVEADVVISVPDSSNAAALGYARASRIPLAAGLIRNHYIGRTFIEPHQGIRDFGAKLKYNPVCAVVAGRRVVVIDDSIVRGTTSRKIITMLRQAGAREIHMRITAPPWKHPCFYGIDTPDPNELIAAHKSVEEIRRTIGADSLGFLSTKALLGVLEQTKPPARERQTADSEQPPSPPAARAEGFCMACFDGRYPGGRPRGLSKHVLENNPTYGRGKSEEVNPSSCPTRSQSLTGFLHSLVSNLSGSTTISDQEGVWS